MTTSKSVQRIALTAGEPAGIGPDLCIKLAQTSQECELVVIADPTMLEMRAAKLNLPLKLFAFDPLAQAKPQTKGSLTIFPSHSKRRTVCGLLDKKNSPYVLETIRLGAQGCLDGLFAALVTAPVHKGIINDAGLKFIGHTEYIAKITQGFPVMMLVTEGLRVALATTHLPLCDVSKGITKKKLTKTIQLLERDLRQKLGVRKPNILVCGLNPHAGESGHLGMEEIKIITPVLNKFREEGFQIQGPLPADTAFTPKNIASADVILAMYHDQGLPVLKHMGFGKAVNITLGLPIIRTSVDHGTALELSGTGVGEIGSLELAIKMALEMVDNNPMFF